MIKMQDILTEITLGAIEPYATQFVWSDASDGTSLEKPQETHFDADGVKITIVMVPENSERSPGQWSVAILAPTTDGAGVTVAHDRSGAVGRVSYLRLLSTTIEALLDFIAIHRPESIDITGSDTTDPLKQKQKNRIYRALLRNNNSKFISSGYNVFDQNGKLWLIHRGVANHRNADSTGIS